MKQKSYYRIGRPVKETMNYCPDCMQVWEIVKQNNGSQGKLVHYTDFPILGKPKEICPACKVKMNEKLNQIVNQ